VTQEILLVSFTYGRTHRAGVKGPFVSDDAYRFVPYSDSVHWYDPITSEPRLLEVAPFLIELSRTDPGDPGHLRHYRMEQEWQRFMTVDASPNEKRTAGATYFQRSGGESSTRFWSIQKKKTFTS
jgi:hypothetical protein